MKKNKIKHITMSKTNNHVKYSVYYENKVVTYTHNDNLPNTVVKFITECEQSETIVTPFGTVTRFL